MSDLKEAVSLYLENNPPKGADSVTIDRPYDGDIFEITVLFDSGRKYFTSLVPVCGDIDDTIEFISRMNKAWERQIEVEMSRYKELAPLIAEAVMHYTDFGEPILSSELGHQINMGIEHLHEVLTEIIEDRDKMRGLEECIYREVSDYTRIYD